MYGVRKLVDKTLTRSILFRKSQKLERVSSAVGADMWPLEGCSPGSEVMAIEGAIGWEAEAGTPD